MKRGRRMEEGEENGREATFYTSTVPKVDGDSKEVIPSFYLFFIKVTEEEGRQWMETQRLKLY